MAGKKYAFFDINLSFLKKKASELRPWKDEESVIVDFLDIDGRERFLPIFESLILPHLHIQFGCQLHLRKACLFSSGSEHLHLPCFRSLQGNHLLVSAALRHRSRTLSSVLRRSYQTVQSFSQKRKKAVSRKGTTVNLSMHRPR